jgi:uncharacterized protein involved in response to NO
MESGAIATAVSRPRAYQGWPLLASGFRPFFLLGSIYAGLAVLVWLPVFYGELTLTSAFGRATGTCMKCSMVTCRR